MTCQCAVCEFAKRVDRVKRLEAELRAMIDELYDRFVHAEMDENWAAAVIDGSRAKWDGQRM